MLAAVLAALVLPAAARAAFASQAGVTTDDGGSGKGLGAGVAVSGDTLATIALNRAVNGKPAGVVFVFTKPAGGSWADATLAAVLSPTPSTDGEQLSSVAIDGDTIGVGLTAITLSVRPAVRRRVRVGQAARRLDQPRRSRPC
jgi:hypothetical protein